MAGELTRVEGSFYANRGDHWLPHIFIRDCTEQELNACRSAVQFVTANNPYLLRGFYGYYSSHELVVGSVHGDRVMETSANSDTVISRTFNIITAARVYLGGLLIHELVHTRHTGEAAMGAADFLEGDAYGVEWVIATRFGDFERARRVANTVSAGGIYGNLAAQVQNGRARFAIARAVVTIMMDICDNNQITNSSLQAQIGATLNHPLAGISRGQAQQLVTEFIMVGRSASGNRLNDILGWLTPGTVNSVLAFYYGQR